MKNFYILVEGCELGITVITHLYSRLVYIIMHTDIIYSRIGRLINYYYSAAAASSKYTDVTRTKYRTMY